MLLPVASAGHLSAVFASPSEIKTGTIAIKTHWFPTHWLDAPWCFPRWWTWNFKGSPLKSQNTPRYWKGCTKRKYTKILGWFLKYIKIHQGKKYTKTLTLIPKIHQNKKKYTPWFINFGGSFCPFSNQPSHLCMSSRSKGSLWCVLDPCNAKHWRCHGQRYVRYAGQLCLVFLETNNWKFEGNARSQKGLFIQSVYLQSDL